MRRSHCLTRTGHRQATAIPRASMEGRSKLGWTRLEPPQTAFPPHTLQRKCPENRSPRCIFPAPRLPVTHHCFHEDQPLVQLTDTLVLHLDDKV